MLNITKDFVYKDSSRLKAKTTEIQKLEFLTAKKNKNLFQTKKKKKTCCCKYFPQ